MPRQLVVLTVTLVAWLMCSSILRAQTAAPKPSADEAKDYKWNTALPPKSTYDPPVRDLSGIWDAGTEGGVQPNGVFEFPDDPEHVGHDVPYTDAGKAARMKNKPGEGEGQVPVAYVNDPVDFCDVQGFPRNDLYEFRAIQLVQTKYQVLVLNQFNKTWRVIWTDGRELPKDPAPTWDGYAVGKWVDDYTFVAQYVGMDPRTWIDNVGRPHSDALRVEERWHLVDHDTLQLTVTIDDPKYYTQPWKALNKFVLHRLSEHHDMYQFVCSVTETQEYNKLVGNPVAPPVADDPANK